MLKESLFVQMRESYLKKNKPKFENSHIDEVKTSLSEIEKIIGWQNLIQFKLM